MTKGTKKRRRITSQLRLVRERTRNKEGDGLNNSRTSNKRRKMKEKRNTTAEFEHKPGAFAVCNGFNGIRRAAEKRIIRKTGWICIIHEDGRSTNAKIYG